MIFNLNDMVFMEIPKDFGCHGPNLCQAGKSMCMCICLHVNNIIEDLSYRLHRLLRPAEDLNTNKKPLFPFPSRWPL